MLLISLLSMLLTSQEVRISTLDGQTIDGSLTAIAADAVTIQAASGEQKIALETIMALDVKRVASPQNADPEATQPSQQVLLHDGSLISGTSVTRTAQQLSVVSAEFGELRIPTTAVRAVRLQPDDPKYSGQWATFLQREGDKDLLIIRKRSGDGLDFLPGIITAISAEQVGFLLDGDNVPVPAARVYGMVFAKPTAPISQVGISLLTLTNEQLRAASMTSDGTALQIVTAWDQPIHISLDRLQRIDFSSGRIRYLSDLPPIREVFMGIDPEGSLFSGLIDKETAQLMYGPRRDTTIDPVVPIRLRGRRFEKGLCIHSKTSIEWPLDRKFSSLDAIVGVDDEVAFNQVSQVSLTIFGDGEVLFQKVFTTSEDPVPVKVRLEGVSTLKILVDYADNDSTCDWLDLADAKLILVPEDNK